MPTPAELGIRVIDHFTLGPLVKWEGEQFKRYEHTVDGNEPESWKPYLEGTKTGETYDLLIRKSDNALVMSNLPMEVRSNRGIIDKAYGDVLLIGLGINLINDMVFDSPKTNTVTTVELFEEVIANTPTKTRIEQQDATKPMNFGNRKFDIIWFDAFCGFDEKLFRPHLKTNGQLICWNP